jgi:hypothetical protein
LPTGKLLVGVFVTTTEFLFTESRFTYTMPSVWDDPGDFLSWTPVWEEAEPLDEGIYKEVVLTGTLKIE